MLWRHYEKGVFTDYNFWRNFKVEKRYNWTVSLEFEKTFATSTQAKKFAEELDNLLYKHGMYRH